MTLINLQMVKINFNFSIIQMPATTIRILLIHTKWEKQHLLDKLTAENCDDFFEKAHVLNPFADTNEVEHAPDELHQCNICFIEVSQNVSFFFLAQINIILILIFILFM